MRIARREALPDHPEGDLLQAGPLLVEHGRIAFDPASDAEGFSAAAEQFDSDITAGRHPRAAIGLGDDHVTVVTCDGRRSLIDGGLTMLELAEIMRELGCEVAMNLDGGGSTTMVHRGPSAQPALHRAGPAGARLAPDRHRACARPTRLSASTAPKTSPRR